MFSIKTIDYFELLPVKVKSHYIALSSSLPFLYADLEQETDDKECQKIKDKIIHNTMEIKLLQSKAISLYMDTRPLDEVMLDISFLLESVTLDDFKGIYEVPVFIENNFDISQAFPQDYNGCHAYLKLVIKVQYNYLKQGKYEDELLLAESLIIHKCEELGYPPELETRELGQPIKKSIEELPTELDQFYFPLMQGPLINSFNGIVSANALQINEYDTQGYIETKQGTSIIFDDLTSNGLSMPTQKVFRCLQLKLTKQLPNNCQDLNKLARDRKVALSVKEYMEMCGLKDRKTARENLKRAAVDLYGISIKGDRQIQYKDRKGNIHTETETKYIRLLESRTETSKSGVFTFEFTESLALYLSNDCYIMAYPKELLKLSAKSLYSEQMGHKIALHYNQNRTKTNSNYISTRAILDSCNNMPTYEEVMAEDKQVSRRIIKPFEKAMEELVNIGYLTEWYYLKPNKGNLTDEELADLDYQTFIGLSVFFSLAETPPKKA